MVPGRTDVQCRERFMNNLNPGACRGGGWACLVCAGRAGSRPLRAPTAGQGLLPAASTTAGTAPPRASLQSAAPPRSSPQRCPAEVAMGKPWDKGEDARLLELAPSHTRVRPRARPRCLLNACASRVQPAAPPHPHSKLRSTARRLTAFTRAASPACAARRPHQVVGGGGAPAGPHRQALHRALQAADKRVRWRKQGCLLGCRWAAHLLGCMHPVAGLHAPAPAPRLNLPRFRPPCPPSNHTPAASLARRAKARARRRAVGASGAARPPPQQQPAAPTATQLRVARVAALAAPRTRRAAVQRPLARAPP